jgi:RNA polymerase sigma-70 factor (ECF subfamily)
LTDLDTILQQCKKNNRYAQQALYEWLAPKLLAVSIRYMKDRDEAEDVMQDSFVKIFTSLNSFKANGSFEGWARRITANTALSAIRKKGSIYFERDLQLVANVEFNNDDESLLSTEVIMNCIDKLPLGYRTIINLYLVEEFTHEEIATQLGITASTSRSQCARARQALLKLLKTKTELAGTKNA